jgi:hypothetical protein
MALAVKQAAFSSQVCPPKLSHARTRAERDWAKMFGAANAADLPALLTRRRQPVSGRPGRIGGRKSPHAKKIIAKMSYYSNAYIIGEPYV